MIKARSRLSWLVRLKDKPIRDGMKVYAMCCATTGYCFDILIQSWSASDHRRPGFDKQYPWTASTVATVMHMVANTMLVRATCVLCEARSTLPIAHWWLSLTMMLLLSWSWPGCRCGPCQRLHFCDGQVLHVLGLGCGLAACWSSLGRHCEAWSGSGYGRHVAQGQSHAVVDRVLPSQLSHAWLTLSSSAELARPWACARVRGCTLHRPINATWLRERTQHDALSTDAAYLWACQGGAQGDTSSLA